MSRSRTRESMNSTMFKSQATEEGIADLAHLFAQDGFVHLSEPEQRLPPDVLARAFARVETVFSQWVSRARAHGVLEKLLQPRAEVAGLDGFYFRSAGGASRLFARRGDLKKLRVNN